MGHIPWLDYLDTLDDKGLAPLTKLAQRWIYERQHPPARDCPTHKFLVSEGTQEIGLGAYLHKQGFGLGAALEADLIFVMEPVGSREGAFDFADDCGSNGDPMTSQECFTQPLSSCSHRDAVVGRNAWKFGSRMWDVVNANGVKFYKDDCPSFLKEKLQAYYRGTDLTPAFFKLWWRAQSAAYLSRLNAETTDHLRTARRDAELHQTWLHGNDGRPTAGVPYPLPPGTSSLHVRHGDKASEMTLVPFEKYVDAAERYSSENPLAGRKALFVSSESPGVIENAARLPDDGRKKQLTSADEHWQVFTSNIPRFNSGPYQQIRKYGPSTMTRSWYLQLWMALECDAFFGTRASNWNRIIDEFRCIFVDKCQLPYFELGPETDWDEYFW
ncbi:hypothetical protein HKX48_003742 [Thoreauomyces humboldtii]|nr:hypothetical protein HKX48_003742 [Thoreauomyces humboldtii]